VRSVALALLGALVVMGACTVKPVTLATLEGDAGSDAGPDAFSLDAGPACVQYSDCPANMFCDKPHCKSPYGVCMPIPEQTSPTEQPVCGCDGITYFNNDVREEWEIASTIPGPGGEPEPCSRVAATCKEPGECPLGAYCDLLIRNPMESCPSPGPPPPGSPPPQPGICWRLPDTCPDGGALDQWNACNDGPKPLQCVPTCTAIQSEKVYVRALMCP
jgi:hypothetical protein